MEPPNQQKKNPVKSALPKPQSEGKSHEFKEEIEALAAKIGETAREAKRVQQVAVTLHRDMETTEANLQATEKKLKRVERKAALLHNHIRSTRKRASVETRLFTPKIGGLPHR